MTGLGTITGKCQDLRSLLGHQHGVLKLCRQFPIRGSYRPVVITINLGAVSPDVDHRFNRETDSHRNANTILVGKNPRAVGNRRILVELAAQTMSHVFPYHGKTIAVCFLLDRVANFSMGHGPRLCGWSHAEG